MEPGITVGQLDLALDERFQRLRPELGFESFGLNLMHLAPGQRGRIHRHEHQEEVYVVLEGTLTIEADDDGERHELGVGGIARVAPEVRRQLSNRGSSPVRFLSIGGAGEHPSRDGVAYTGWDDTAGAAPQDVPLPDDLPEQPPRRAP
jgi:uncharacterized cupin superfamily protein